METSPEGPKGVISVIIMQRKVLEAAHFLLILPALCVLLLQRCLSFLDVLLQGGQPALPLLLALLTKQLTGHPFQGKDANSLRAHTDTATHTWIHGAEPPQMNT